MVIKSARYLKNRSPTKALDGQTPYQAINGSKPDVTNLRIIGSLAYAHVPQEKRKKLDSHTNIGIFVGYTNTDRMVTIYDPIKRTVKDYRDVIIDESKRWGNRITELDEIEYFEYSSWDNDTYIDQAPEPYNQGGCGHGDEADTVTGQGVHQTDDSTETQGDRQTPADDDDVESTIVVRRRLPSEHAEDSQIPNKPQFPRCTQRTGQYASITPHESDDTLGYIHTEYSYFYAVRVDPDPDTPSSL